MRIITKKFYLRIGWEYFGGIDRNHAVIALGIGKIEDAPENVIPWKFWWSRSFFPPRLIRSGTDHKIIGFCIFGRCRIFR